MLIAPNLRRPDAELLRDLFFAGAGMTFQDFIDEDLLFKVPVES